MITTCSKRKQCQQKHYKILIPIYKTLNIQQQLWYAELLVAEVQDER